MRLTVRLDDAPALHRTARMVLVGNVGTVQGGLSLLPSARPDDGLLELMILDPHGPSGWLRALTTVLRGRSGASHPTLPDTAEREGGKSLRVEYLTFRRAELRFDAPCPREIDGDPVNPGSRLTVTVAPGALSVLLPLEEA